MEIVKILYTHLLEKHATITSCVFEKDLMTGKYVQYNVKWKKKHEGEWQ